MQVTKTALKELARVEDPSWLNVDRTDPSQNIRAGTLYARVLRDRFGSVSIALNRYGDGPGYSKVIIAATAALRDNARLPPAMRKTPAEVLKKVFGR
jgi:soluble lytic murein transglycosylase-like protein